MLFFLINDLSCEKGNFRRNLEEGSAARFARCGMAKKSFQQNTNS